MTRTEMVLEMLVYSPFNHLMRLLAQEYLFEFSYHDSFKLYGRSTVWISFLELCTNSILLWNASC